MVVANILSYILVLIGAFNWGLYGIFDFNLVGWICMGSRSVGAIIIYVLVTLAAIWLIVSPIISMGVLKLAERKENKNPEAAEYKG
ncbi:MAG: DUF378 domain-containing protein [Clostridia bacterium]|nr:DUF378 domain-containing protein [Clostridia bacterium]